MERINYERLEFFEKRINEIFNQVTEENNLSLEDLDKLFSTNLELKNKINRNASKCRRFKLLV